ncbi:MAG: hypothetical protein GX444_15610 [Myxococcales bacterium]|nr:hypothetical protein [Myxococcales bacterium]
MSGSAEWKKMLVLLFALCLGLTLAGCDCGDDDDDNDDNNPVDDDDTSPGDDDNDDASPDDDDDDNDDNDDDDTTPSPAEPYCTEGKDLLQAAAGGLAAQKFRAGLDLDDGAVNCRYGLLLADTLTQFDTISVAVSYIESFIEGYQPPAKDDWPQTGQGFLDEVLSRILDGLLFEASDEAIEQAEWLRENEPDVVYPVDTLPIILNFSQVADAAGDYDLPDAVAAEGFAGMLPGLAAHLTALNLDFDIGLIFEVVNLDFGMPIEDLLGVLVDDLLRLFNNPLYPDFFTLKDDAAPFKAAGLKTGLGFRHTEETLKLILAEEGDQSNEVLGYDDQNGNQQWDEGEGLIAPPNGVLTDEENVQALAIAQLAGHLADSFLDYTDYDNNPAESQPFRLAYLNDVLTAFGLPALIPDLDALVIDFGAAYRDANPTSLRNTIRTILLLLDSFLP